MTDQELDRILDSWETPEPPPSLRRGLVAALPPKRRSLFGVRLRWVIACAAAALPVAIGTSLFDPEGRIGIQSQGASTAAGQAVYVRVSGIAAPAIASVKWWFKGSAFSIGPTPDGAIRGIAAVHDRSAGSYYGYEYNIHPSGDGRYRVAILPLTFTDLDRGPFAAKGSIVPLSDLPLPRVVDDGGSADVEVYRASGNRLYLRLEIASRPFPGMFQPQKLRDDQLRLIAPKLFVNGVSAGSEANQAMGATVWARIPGHSTGRYLIALDPMHTPNFQPNGKAAGTVLEFRAGGSAVRIECAEPVVMRDRDLFVFEDPAFERQVKPGYSGPMFGSSGPACIFNGSCLKGK